MKNKFSFKKNLFRLGGILGIFLIAMFAIQLFPVRLLAEENAFKNKLANFFADKIRVMGEVNRPGIMKFEEGITVWDAITKAGGISPVADVQEIKIRRQQGDKLELIPVFVGIEFKKNIPLNGGDLILVPEHKQKAERVFGELLEKYPAARQKIMQLKNKGFSEQWIRTFIYQITEIKEPDQAPSSQ